MSSFPVTAADAKQPHAVCIPYPAQGHINPMLNLAKLLHHRGFHITFIYTEYNHKRLLKSRGPNSLNGLPDFQFKTIPDGLPPSDDIDATQSIPDLCESTSKNCLLPFRDVVSDLKKDLSLPPVSCIVSDGIMSFTLAVARELDIPVILLWTTSVCGFMGYLQFPYLVQNGLIPLKDKSYETNGYLDALVDWIPGVKDIHLRDLPSFIRTTDPNAMMTHFVLGEIERASKVSAIVFNTFQELEDQVLSAIKHKLPPIYTIGSLHLLINQVTDKAGLGSLGSNLWKEEECLQWLDTKAPNSVVYVNFGSITVMTLNQITEFAWGLANSKQTFLWAIRPDLVSGDTAMLSQEFIAETKERGLLASWCPQEQVLNHPSVAGFLTHSGWNSTLESVCSGVPMICWPFFAEQQMNATYTCVHWGIGMEIDTNVKRDQVESLVRELMEGIEGKKMRMKAMEWKRKAVEAVAPGGTSYVNMDRLVSEILTKT
ncbi:7-deoxyloganetin glucosyltransferase [Ranunculus cassubicifolius]